MTTDSLIVVFGGSVITALVGAVGFLFKIVMQNKADIQSELNECQEDREALWKEIANLNSRIPKKAAATDGTSPIPAH